MAELRFQALVVHGAGDRYTRAVEERTLADLPDGEVLVRVRYSSLNYKDALSASGHPGITRRYPHTPGIDAAGIVEASTDPRFRPGDAVIVTGYDLGMNTPGGFAGYVRVPADWPLPLPAGLSLRESMMLGTAGFTAALSVLRLARHGVAPDAGDVLVTGATGGVGSLAIGVLARAGYRVVAATGKPEQGDYLRALGAAEIVARDELLRDNTRPLHAERWSGAVDCVGGELLAAVLKATRYGGAVACCGMVGAPLLTTTVYPFILRAVALLGIDSARCAQDVRREVWGRLAGEWKPAQLDLTVHAVGLDGLDAAIETMLHGRHRGRTLVEIGDGAGEGDTEMRDASRNA